MGEQLTGIEIPFSSAHRAERKVVRERGCNNNGMNGKFYIRTNNVAKRFPTVSKQSFFSNQLERIAFVKNGIRNDNDLESS